MQNERAFSVAPYQRAPVCMAFSCVCGGAWCSAGRMKNKLVLLQGPPYPARLACLFWQDHPNRAASGACSAHSVWRAKRRSLKKKTARHNARAQHTQFGANLPPLRASQKHVHGVTLLHY